MKTKKLDITELLFGDTFKDSELTQGLVAIAEELAETYGYEYVELPGVEITIGVRPGKRKEGLAKVKQMIEEA